MVIILYNKNEVLLRYFPVKSLVLLKQNTGKKNGGSTESKLIT